MSQSRNDWPEPGRHTHFYRTHPAILANLPLGGQLVRREGAAPEGPREHKLWKPATNGPSELLAGDALGQRLLLDQLDALADEHLDEHDKLNLSFFLNEFETNSCDLSELLANLLQHLLVKLASPMVKYRLLTLIKQLYVDWAGGGSKHQLDVRLFEAMTRRYLMASNALIDKSPASSPESQALSQSRPNLGRPTTLKAQVGFPADGSSSSGRLGRASNQQLQRPPLEGRRASAGFRRQPDVPDTSSAGDLASCRVANRRLSGLHQRRWESSYLASPLAGGQLGQRAARWSEPSAQVSSSLNSLVCPAGWPPNNGAYLVPQAPLASGKRLEEEHYAGWRAEGLRLRFEPDERQDQDDGNNGSHYAEDPPPLDEVAAFVDWGGPSAAPESAILSLTPDSSPEETLPMPIAGRRLHEDSFGEPSRPPPRLKRDDLSQACDSRPDNSLLSSPFWFADASPAAAARCDLVRRAPAAAELARRGPASAASSLIGAHEAPLSLAASGCRDCGPAAVPRDSYARQPPAPPDWSSSCRQRCCSAVDTCAPLESAAAADGIMQPPAQVALLPVEQRSQRSRRRHRHRACPPSSLHNQQPHPSIQSKGGRNYVAFQSRPSDSDSNSDSGLSMVAGKAKQVAHQLPVSVAAQMKKQASSFVAHQYGRQRPGRAQKAELQVRRTLRVKIRKSKPILGIAIEGGYNVSGQLLPRIVCVHEDGAAYQCGKLRASDLILEVNGTPTVNMTHDQIAKTIASAYYDDARSHIEFLIGESVNI